MSNASLFDFIEVQPTTPLEIKNCKSNKSKVSNPPKKYICPSLFDMSEDVEIVEDNQEINEILEASRLLKLTGQNVSYGNLARLLNCSKAMMQKRIKKHEKIIHKNQILSVKKPKNREECTGHGNIHPEPYVSVDRIYLLQSLFLKPINQQTNEVNIKEFGIQKIMSACIQLSLEATDYFHHNCSFRTKQSYSDAIQDITMNIISSNGVHSQNKSYKFLQAHDKQYSFSKLFERYGNYVVGVKGYKQRLTQHMKDTILKDAVSIFLELKLNRSKPIADDFILPFDVVSDLQYRDLFYMLSLCSGVTEEGYVIRNEVKDTQFSRVYSVFTSITSDARKKLGWINYDMSAALQTIALNILGAENYPLHKVLMEDKHRFRSHLMKRLNKTLPEVKQMLSAIDNGKHYPKLAQQSRVLKRYIEEAQNLAHDFNCNREINTPEQHKRALSFAKPLSVFTGKYNPDNGAKIFKFSDEKNKFSTFFFNWTQIEREIRNVMISMIKGKYHEVHDAVYCKEVISIEEMETKIYNSLGLSIKIEN